MSTLNESRQPSLKDKLEAQEKALKQESVAVEVEIKAVTKARVRAGKKS